MIILQRHERKLLFRWDCTWFGQKEPIKVQNFRLSTAHLKFHQLCTLIDSFCWKCLKVKLKNIAVMSHHSEDWSRIWRKTDLLLQRWQKFGEFWPKHLIVSKICTFIGSYCAKYLKFDNKEWCEIWRKNWLVVWKMKWGILQIWKVTRVLESLKIGSLMGSFNPK